MIGNSFYPLDKFVVFAIAIAFLSACGGGGSGGATSQRVSPAPQPPTPGTGSQEPQWTAGVFEPASRFKDRCEQVRTGVDIEGNPFPDQPGSMTQEKFWLRSWTEETYLWNDEVVDRDPQLFADRIAYFDQLKTNAVTASGEDKDDFHFAESTAEFLNQRNAEPTADYGVSFEVITSAPPRDFRVRFTDPGTPAAEVVGTKPKFLRGARILEIDGIDFINGATIDEELDLILDALFPRNAGEVHEFLMRDPDGEERLVTVTAAQLPPDPVNRTRIISTPSGPVGYILFNTFSPFSSEQEIVDAIDEMEKAAVTDLVLDLRYNGGGLLAVASQLSYMIAGPAFTSGKVFEQLRFNDDAGALNPVTGERNDPVPFFRTGLGFSVDDGAALPLLPDVQRVFVLSTDQTCSASEAVINSLRGVDFEVVLIGDTTCGKPFGFYPQDNCGITYYTIQFQGTNAKGFGDYADGFVPMNSDSAFGVKIAGCQVPDDFDHELGDEKEGLLAAALTYRSTGQCPAPPSSVAFGAAASTFSRAAADRSFPLALGRGAVTLGRDLRLSGQ